MIGMLVVQDLAVMPMLVILPQLGDFETSWGKLARAIGHRRGFLVAVVLLGTWLLPGLLQRILGGARASLFLVAVVATGVGVGYALTMAGLSFAIGAFVAGLVLSESEFSHQALSDVVPLRDIFGLLFFVSVGMLFDPRYACPRRPGPGRRSLIVVGKALIFGLLARAFGYGNMAPWIVGLGLSQIGEFSFVLARMGSSTGGSFEGHLRSRADGHRAHDGAFAVCRLALPLGRLWRRLAKPAPAPSAGRFRGKRRRGT